MTTKLSILIPIYNEEEWLPTVIARVLAVQLGDNVETEIIAVNDASTDGTAEVLDELQTKYPGRINVFRHEKNRGKGAAIRTAIAHATGEFAVIQDSDL